MDPLSNIPLRFDNNWGLKEMNKFLHKRFPRLFSHFAETFPEILTIKAEPNNIGTLLEDVIWPYTIVLKDHTKLEVFPTIKYPTGTIFLVKSSSHATGGSWSERVIYLGKFYYIPESNITLSNYKMHCNTWQYQTMRFCMLSG
jgi:hypothetical protein